MNNHTQSSANIHPVIQLIRSFINKLRQNPDVYPIKYYKKGHHRSRRVMKYPMVK
ncbi:MAG: hypothetical protein JST81_04890 [Bacteroidetes bacterium]|nr:hypothetical protein [Bacteroidota bacterium]